MSPIHALKLQKKLRSSKWIIAYIAVYIAPKDVNLEHWWHHKIYRETVFSFGFLLVIEFNKYKYLKCSHGILSCNNLNEWHWSREDFIWQCHSGLYWHSEKLLIPSLKKYLYDIQCTTYLYVSALKKVYCNYVSWEINLPNELEKTTYCYRELMSFPELWRATGKKAVNMDM